MNPNELWEVSLKQIFQKKECISVESDFDGNSQSQPNDRETEKQVPPNKILKHTKKKAQNKHVNLKQKEWKKVKGLNFEYQQVIVVF